MQVLLHLAGFCAYAGLAAALAVHGTRLSAAGLPALTQTEAYGLAGLVFLAGALLHEVLARHGQITLLRDRLAYLVHEFFAQQEEADWVRRELAGLREAMEASTTSGDARGGGHGGGRTIDEVMSEVKVLKSLIGRLSGGSGAPPASPRARPVAASTALALRARVAEEAPTVLPPVERGLNQDQILATVREALRNDQVDLVLQPIVSLPQRKRRFYECFSRLRTGDDGLIVPEQYIAVAERAGLVAAIDNMLLFRCVQLIRKIHRKNEDVDFFCNISPHTLADVDFFSDFIDFLESNEELAGHLIFEFAQADFARWSGAGVRLLERLTRLGCRFSLDQVRDLDLDPDELAARHVRFIKVEAGLLIDALDRNGGLLRALRRRRIDLIVEKVEDERRLIELLDYEVDYGQGYLFGEPRLARPAA